eukprot:TRINITY_DN4995_c0_g1_i1.p1 TRINITY_DN4995_c0_g1~~TRINITY_DN4995_c0_g1_i1.p1  ORF type:complete len:346 (+),score=35.74 TRINITY_DN4995_c0_g1_i1:176-1213(+)
MEGAERTRTRGGGKSDLSAMVRGVSFIVALLLATILPSCRFSGAEAEVFAYNRSLAYIAVEFASAVYTDDVVVLRNWTCSRCGGQTKGFQVKEVVIDYFHKLQGIIGFSPMHQSVVIAFRGTRETSLANWIADLQFRQLDFQYPGVHHALVHTGFFSAYHNTTLRERIPVAFKSMMEAYPGLPTLITGHSMGGAIATLCALDLKINFGFTGIRVVTFGQPRVGNQAFAEYYHRHFPQSMRLTHDHDAVPHLPPFRTPAGSMNYYHVPTEIWLCYVGAERRYLIEKVCDSSGEDPRCSRSVKGTSIADHLMYLGVPLKSVDEDFLSREFVEIHTPVLKHTFADEFS